MCEANGGSSCEGTARTGSTPCTSTTRLAEGDAGGAVEGKTDFGRTGWGGPMPPKGHGVHHYHFKLYALDAELNLAPRATKRDLLRAMGSHVLAEAAGQVFYQDIGRIHLKPQGLPGR